MAKVLLGFLLLMAAVVVAPHADAQPSSGAEVYEDLIHADLPLYNFETENLWPRGFVGADSFGCVSRVAFGDWVFRRAGVTEDDDAQWYRFRSYGAFHCFAIVASAYERAALEHADGKSSFFILLETINIDRTPVELWAIQIGGRPGSDYLLLSREPADGSVVAFNVLQTQCPARDVRDAGPLDILHTSYCAINSQSELVNLAREMARRPPLGTLALVESNAGD
jgi:hypothetical protein